MPYQDTALPTELCSNKNFGWCTENRTQISRLKVCYFTIKLYTNIKHIKLVATIGFEPMTNALSKRCSTILSYVAINLAVVIGLEPMNAGFKIQCLTNLAIPQYPLKHINWLL